MSKNYTIWQLTAAQWQRINPRLLCGQWGLEKDTDKVKLGKDGDLFWNDTPYFEGKIGPPGPQGLQGAAGSNGTDATITTTNFGATVHAGTADTLDDTSEIPFWKAVGAVCKITWSNLKLAIKGYTDTLYAVTGHSHSAASTLAAGFGATGHGPGSEYAQCCRNRKRGNRLFR